jgi:hypothetical protein
MSAPHVAAEAARRGKTRRNLVLCALVLAIASSTASVTHASMFTASCLSMIMAAAQASKARPRKRSMGCLLPSGEVDALTSGHKRRVVIRANGGWLNSTLAGYLADGDEITYRHNFRVTRKTFDCILGHLQSNGYLLDNSCRDEAKCVTGRFKIAVGLYFFAQGTGWKAAADCASMGESTVRNYVNELIDGTLRVLKPIYMPSDPPSRATLDHIRSQFASRRGVPNVAMAVDGSHVPFRPEVAHANDYRNYKGWRCFLHSFCENLETVH